MNQLINDYFKENYYDTDNDIENIELNGDKVHFDEFCPSCPCERLHHSIELLDIISWMYCKTRNPEEPV